MRGHWMLGNDEQAYAIFRYQHQFEIGRHDPYFVADHLIGFAGLSQQWDLGCQLIRRHLNQHLASTTANTRFQMLMRLGLFLRLWMSHGPSGPKKIRFARKTSPTQPLLEGTHAADKLHDWVEAEARKIADIMDARNGNSFHHRWLEQHPRSGKILSAFGPRLTGLNLAPSVYLNDERWHVGLSQPELGCRADSQCERSGRVIWH